MVPLSTTFSLLSISFYDQFKVNEPFFRVAAGFWIPTRHVFHFNGMELWPTLKEFGAIMGKLGLGSIIAPTLEEDLSYMVHRLLGVPLAMAKKWCTPDKLNV